MTRTQFIASIAAIPFIGKMFKKPFQRYEYYGKLEDRNGLYYTFWSREYQPGDLKKMVSCDGGKTWTEVEFEEIPNI